MLESTGSDLSRHSRTAIATCLMRCIHTKYDRPALIDDDWADRLVLPEERNAMAAAIMHAMPAEQRDRFLSAGAADAILHTAWHSLSLYAGVIIRTRYTEENIRAAVEAGIRQYVIIGAGLDSFGLRQPDYARDMQVFEVDHPASQQFKRGRLDACGAQIPGSLHFVPADLSSEDLGDALKCSAFQFDQPAIFSWLGVTIYLTRQANLATLGSIGRFAFPGSRLVFTYIEQRALNSDSPAMQRIKAGAAAVGEPWISGFDSATLSQDLENVGLKLVEDLGGAEMHQRYCADRADGLSPGKAGRIAMVVKADRR